MMRKKRQQVKVQRFINELSKSIAGFDTSKENYNISISVDVDRNSNNHNNNSLKYNLTIEAELSEGENEHYHLYSLSKKVTLPYFIDISNMTLETIEFDIEALKAILKSDEISQYKLVEAKKTMISYPTLLVRHKQATVTGGFEKDYIYPVIKQNNPHASMTDEELNRRIRNDKRFTQFIGNR
jgi:hypothetical protein